MSQLDRFLGALAEYKADALILEQDQTPAFKFMSGTKAVSKTTLPAQRILTLVSEITDAAVIQEFESQGSASFSYQLDSVAYSGVIEEDSGTIVATLWETAKNMGAAMTDSDEMSFADVAASLEDSNILSEAAPEPQISQQAAPTPVAEAAPPLPETPAPAPAAQAAAPQASAIPTLPSFTDISSDSLVPNDMPDHYRQDMEKLLRRMIDEGASDLHLSCGMPPMLRVDGEMRELEAGQEPIDPDHLFRMLFSIAPNRNREEFVANKDTDCAYAIEGVSRYRCNYFFDRNGPAAVFRAIPSEIIPASKLGLPPVIQELAMLNKGLVLVTGPTGSGKSTTLAGIVDLVNEKRREHIITIEDPVEFVHQNKSCLINQREVGVHTKSFKNALRAALREDPDVVLVGELRDLETIAIAIETAETGHLVFGTLHTTTAASTVDRIIDQFPPDQQAQIRVMLSESLKAVIAQTLCRKKGGGRVAALEILLGTQSISNLIREGKTFQIESTMQTGKKLGMQTLNDHLTRLVQDGTIEASEAHLKAVDKKSLIEAFERNGIQL